MTQFHPLKITRDAALEVLFAMCPLDTVEFGLITGVSIRPEGTYWRLANGSTATAPEEMTLKLPAASTEVRP